MTTWRCEQSGKRGDDLIECLSMCLLDCLRSSQAISNLHKEAITEC